MKGNIRPCLFRGDGVAVVLQHDGARGFFYATSMIRCGYTPHYRYAFCAPKHTSRLVSSFTKTSSRSCNCVMSSATSSTTRGENCSCSSTYPAINKAHSLTTENPFSSQVVHAGCVCIYHRGTFLLSAFAASSV